jgi:hypothetical protein
MFFQSICFYKFLYISGDSSAHHQEHKTVHTVSHTVKPILLPAAIMDEIKLSTDREHVASCWLYFRYIHAIYKHIHVKLKKKKKPDAFLRCSLY